MKNTLETIVGPCALCGCMFMFPVRTHRPKYCYECARYAAAESNRNRQRAYRQRQREAAKRTAEAAAAALRRPVRGGTQATPRGGLFDTDPEPQRTQRRRKVGLHE